MALSALAVEKAKPKDKSYNLKDDDGLYLEVKPSGKKYWRLRYWIDYKENRMSLGEFPLVSLAEARGKRDEKRRMIKDGVDPVAEKKEARAATSPERTFEGVAREWIVKRENGVDEKTNTTNLRRLELNIFPFIGSRPINDITAPELLVCLNRIEARGAKDVAKRVRVICSQVFRYAIAVGKVDRDVAADLKGALPPRQKQHRAALTDPKEVGQLMLDIANCKASHVVYCALRLAPLVFVRPGELRHAEWTEFDFENALWRIPEKRMKKVKNTQVQHIVPLSSQAIAILKEVKPITGNGMYVFPSTRTASRPMSENTLNVALRRMGYEKAEMCAHGFRGMASTLLNEQGWNFDAIEKQLAHVPRDQVRASYNHAQYLPTRREMMQFWADYLNKLAQEAAARGKQNV